MKLAIIVQRYGEDLAGGAEAHARQIAHHLHDPGGHQVEVLTTTARSYLSWKNELPSGRTRDGPVVVRRFPSRAGRSRWFSLYKHLATPLIRRLQSPRIWPWLGRPLEHLWFRLQGPFNPALLEYLKESHREQKYDFFIFFTYLYHPTLHGVPLAGSRSLLIPTAHDEAAFRFGSVRQMLQQAGALLVNTEPERRLIEEVAPGVSDRIRIAGLGFTPASDESIDRKRSGQPYVLYMGRISRGKGVDHLLQWMAQYNRQSSRAVHLVLAGQREPGLSLPEVPWLTWRGFVDEEEKKALLAGATALINPSSMESLSMIVVEAMAAGIPALVNHKSAVLRHYARESGTVFSYRNQEEFSRNLQSICRTDWQSGRQRARLVASRQWVLQRYSWPAVLRVYQDSLKGPSGEGQGNSSGPGSTS